MSKKETSKRFLDKKSILYERDEEGELIPQEVDLINYYDLDDEVIEDVTVNIVPMSRGKLKKYLNFSRNIKDEEERDPDGEIVLEHVYDKKGKPMFEEEEIPYIKPNELRALTETVLYVSGVPLKSLKKGKVKALEKKETDFPKGSKE